MSTWATRRKFSILGVVFLLLLIPLVSIGYIYFHQPMSCTDGKQNQGEHGVDCGGPCSLMCKSETADAVVSWKRLFKVSPGLYTAVAYIENPNLGAGAKDVPYTFRVYGEDGIVIAERQGTTSIVPKHAFAIVEPGILTGERNPVRMTFEFDQDLVWYQERVQDSPFKVSGEHMTKENSAPRVDATVENPTVKDYKNVEVTAIVYGADGNALGASKTLVDTISAGGSVNVVFTWPTPFTASSTRIEVVPQI